MAGEFPQALRDGGSHDVMVVTSPDRLGDHLLQAGLSSERGLKVMHAKLGSASLQILCTAAKPRIFI
jgi:hypothetical protein